ncbi:S-locus-specific glycoprotein S13-like [Asparagus officinalis]|uniref:S-locus-specific glycoprotein S13-like n=1 Tax=Asparagus officinalis TaxID=4686 RepID=UPI00098E01CA|nr:S-locus-specific glycoprotein S13-like [Asparagus officinalis]
MSKSLRKPLFYLIIFLSLYPSTSRDSLTPTTNLADGDVLLSSTGTFALGFFTPDNSTTSNRYIGIWYNKIPGQTVIWVANHFHPINGTTGILSITKNGSLVITAGGFPIIWLFVSTKQATNPIAQLLDTGNFVVADDTDSNSIAWQGFDYPTDTLIPGMKVGWDAKSGLNRNLTGWSSSTDPSPGIYTLAVDLHGDPQLIFWAGSVREWRSGPWIGRIPFYDNDSMDSFSFTFINNKNEVTYTADMVNNATLTRLVVNPSGLIQRLVLLDSGEWGQYRYLPATQCDLFGVCGPNSLCYIDTLRACSCLPGFEPKSPYDWALKGFTGGCIRKTSLDCRNGTDGFVPVQRTVLPDTVQATVDMSMSFDECRAECLRNCSCTGFANVQHGWTGVLPAVGSSRYRINIKPVS